MKVTDKITITQEDNMLLMARYPDNYFDLAIVDPPYGISYARGKNGWGVNSNRPKLEDVSWDKETPTQEYFNELFRVSKNQIIWGANNFKLPTSEYFVIWQKSNAEDFSFAMCEMAWTNCKIPAKVFKHYHVQTQDKNKVHPTQKPIELYKWILDKYAKEGNKILDTHLGSMSIAIACADYGFELVGCELDPDYYNAGIKRLQNHLSQTKINFDI